jgi:hypothetical protein
MIKYSLQNECLENIEAFSDEQMNREMAVIESVLEIYDKTILMMELSNSDVDIPDCSMFMESTFFQEALGNDQAQTGGEGDTSVNNGGRPAPAPQGDQQNNGQTGNVGQNANNNNNNAQKTPPTNAERDKYNSEHQFRQMNKKGNTENMFISIIAFIPRLLGFIIQSIVKFFKKIFNKESSENIKNAGTNAANASKETLEKAANASQPESGGDDQSQNINLGTFDPKTKRWNMFDGQAMSNILKEIATVLGNINISEYKTLQQQHANLKTASDKLKGFNQIQWYDAEPFESNMATLGEQLDIIKNEAEKQRQNIDANKQNISLQAGADAGSSKVGLATADNLRNLKDLCNGLKELCRSVSNKLDTSLKAFMNCDKSAKIINDESSVKTDDSQDQQPQAQPQQNQGQPQPPQPPVNNNGGGENNG